MAQNVTVAGASYSNVPGIELPITGGGTAYFADPSGVTAVASDVTSGKIFIDANGEEQTGTASGSGSATVATATTTPSSNSTSISFSVDGDPLMFALEWTYTSGSYMSAGSTRYIVSVVCDGTNCYAASVYKSGSSGRLYYYTTATFTYSNGTLRITSPSSSTLGYFRSGYAYKLVYVY